DGDPGEVECTLSWIGTEVDEKTRTVQVRCVTDNPLIASATGEGEGQRRMRAHTFGTARIRVREERESVIVPSAAIQWDGANHLLFIPRTDGRSFAPRVVIPGISRDGYTEIVRGVGAGEAVVSAGSYALKSEIGREQAANRP